MQHHPHPRGGEGALAPTPHADLNATLDALLEGQKRVLGDNLVGLYLQGSFALGGADASSDADFVAVIGRDLDTAEVEALRALHRDLHASAPPWSEKLEGTYAPAEIFRRQTSEPRDPPGEPRGPGWADPGTGGSPARHYPFWFKGNGETELVRSEHDNTQVVRWVTREHGIALFGPPPAELIDPVSADALRAEARQLLRRVVPEWANHPEKMQLRWHQAFMANLTCRLLATIQTGEVRSKRAAADWALANLDPRWAPLIEGAMALRAEPLEAQLQPASDRSLVAETLNFMRHALRLDGKLAEERMRAERGGGPQLPLRGQHRPPPPKWGGPHMGKGAGPAPIRPGGRGRRG